MKLFQRPLLWTMTVLLAAPHAGVSSSSGAEPGASCDRFTLEKVRLGMTRSDLEALSLGKIEVLGETSDTLRLRVRGAKQKQKEMNLVLVHGRVQFIELFQYTDKAGAAATLTDLRGRWGEPDKKEDPDPAQDKPTDRLHAGDQLFRWSDRSCPAYGGYYYNSFWQYQALSSSSNIMRKGLPEFK